VAGYSACRNTSAKYGKPPTFGRTVIARDITACNFSVALLISLAPYKSFKHGFQLPLSVMCFSELLMRLA
jgi:hypothetical protein